MIGKIIGWFLEETYENYTQRMLNKLISSISNRFWYFLALFLFVSGIVMIAIGSPIFTAQMNDALFLYGTIFMLLASLMAAIPLAR